MPPTSGLVAGTTSRTLGSARFRGPQLTAVSSTAPVAASAVRRCSIYTSMPVLGPVRGRALTTPLSRSWVSATRLDIETGAVDIGGLELRLGRLNQQRGSVPHADSRAAGRPSPGLEASPTHSGPR